MKRTRTIIATLMIAAALAPAWPEPEEPAATEVVAQATPTPPPANSQEEARKALAEGRELHRKGFTESAIVQYRKAIDLDPRLKEAYVELGKILVDTRNSGFAITIYEKLSALEPDNLEWKRILFDLYDPYEMPQKAAIVGEDIAAANPDDANFLQRLARIYKDYGATDKYAATLAKAAAVNKDAKLYYEAGEGFLASDMKTEAVEAYRQAVALEPGNLEYQNALGKGLNAAGDAYAARAHYEDLMAKHPEAVGLRDRQAETELTIGDAMLQARRYVHARKAYERAQALSGTTRPELQERLAKAERLNGVYYENPGHFGKTGQNNFSWMRNVVGIPLRDEEITFQIMHDYRYADDPLTGNASLSSFLGGIEYRPTEFSTLFAEAGSNELFRVGGFHQDDNITASLNVRRDIVSYTPLGIARRLHWTGVDGSLAYQFSDWFGLGGDFAFNSYDDNINETLYNLSPRFYPINRPNDFIWAIGYNHGGIFNDRDANPFFRFGPTNFQVDSFGTDVEHWLSQEFRYRVGYYYSTTNVGISGSTFVAGFDAQLGEASYLWLDAELGNFVGGRVNQTSFGGGSASNYLIQGGFRVTF